MISDPIWEAADASGPKLIVRRFEAAWRADPFRRPTSRSFCPTTARSIQPHFSPSFVLT